MKLFLLFVLPLLVTGCSVLPPAQLTHSAGFEPVMPLEKQADRIPTGGIYVSRQSDSWFGRGRNFQVGDVITVLLNESTQAARTQGSDLKRESTNNVITPALQSKTAARLGSPLGSALGAMKLDGSSVSSKGTGKADQEASLTGSIAVNVVNVFCGPASRHA